MRQSRTTPTLLAVITTAAFLASGAALAQTSSPTSPQGYSSSGSSGTSQSHAQASPASQAKLKQQLQQAGFRNVDVLATGYVLQAVSPSGDLVTVSASPQSTGQGTGGTAKGPSATQTKLRQALEQAGFHNVELVERAYVAQAQAPDGNTVVMAVNLPTGQAVGSGSSVPGSAAKGSSTSMGASGAAGRMPSTSGTVGGSSK